MTQQSVRVFFSSEGQSMHFSRDIICILHLNARPRRGTYSGMVLCLSMPVRPWLFTNTTISSEIKQLKTYTPGMFINDKTGPGQVLAEPVATRDVQTEFIF